MFSLLSSRRWLGPCISVTVVIITCRLLFELYLFNCFDISLIFLAQFQHGIHIQRPPTQAINQTVLSDIFDVSTSSGPNKNLSPLLRCALERNNVTSAIRIPRHILNISLASPDSPHDPRLQFFNPTLIPLPPHSPFPYLLLSRLVTEGLHQESHICLARLCSPHNVTNQRSLPLDTQPCTGSDVDILGPQGGVRCAMAPSRLKIPPTAAHRCKGAWAAFPDIPGFHDPRVFWSHKGEPLVIVNSASRYACVGLWVVDLRAVHPELDDLMKHKGRYLSAILDVNDNLQRRSGELQAGAAIPVKMSYPHLTELTRNPRQSRGAVEKNWILFFPKGDESWIMYDLVGHRRRDQRQDENLSSVLNEKLDTKDENESSAVRSNHSTSLAPHRDESKSMSTTAGTRTKVDGGRAIFQSNTDQSTNGTDSTHTHKNEQRASFFSPKPDAILTPSRTLAKVIGSGYTTANLTSPDESPCLTSADLFDSFGNRGHWHQGSNSLRLILCTRHDVACLENHEEAKMVDRGKVVHFAILHRKFSNDLDLPMRYERYVMVWEARFPFRMIGISQHPILFAGERAQPWTVAENGLEDDDEAKRWAAVYFFYTPSLAWSWRKGNVAGSVGGGTTALSTGYLGDEVMVGIGMDDVAQGFVRVQVDELMNCLRLCPDLQDR